MNLLSVCPLRVASLAWQTSRGVPVLTVVAKATYQLLPVTCPVSEEQEDPSAYESHWNYDTERSLHAPSDLVPYKPRPEVTLVGQAFAPRGEAVPRLTARLIVGGVDKSIVVHGDRSFAQDGTLRSGARFARMSLRYERAAGGPETSNPVGVQPRADGFGAVPLPNLEPPALNVTRPDDPIEPVGFGPIAAEWPARRTRLGPLAGSWSLAALADAPVPKSLDPLYFMSAPPDQYLDELRANERLVLENLHPDHPRLVTSLPGYEPRAFVERARGPVTELPMTCDTLWIDTDRSVCTLTWRGQLTLDGAGEEGRVVVAMEMLGRPLDWSAVEPHAAPPSGRTIDISQGAARVDPAAEEWKRATVTEDRRPATPNWPGWLAAGEGEAGPMGALPAPPPPPARPSAPPGALDSAAARARPSLPRPPVAPIAPSFGATPPAPPAPAPPWPKAPPPVPTSWAPPARAPVPPPPPAPLAVTSAAAAVNALRVSYPEPSSAAVRPTEPAPVRAPAPVDLRKATERGAAAASDAAAASTAKPAPVPANRAVIAEPAPEPVRDHVDLLWYDVTALPRIRADRGLREARPAQPPPIWLKEQPGQREPTETVDRRDALAFLSRGKVLDEAAAVSQAASAAYQADGAFVAPLALVAGELGFDFDELETLRAILTVTSPFLGADKKLREVTSSAADALKYEGRLPADIAEGFSRRIEEAFAQGQRAVAPGYLDARVERILLESRRYQRKTLFGDARLRATLTFPDAAPGVGPVPIYLPDTLATRLPLFRRFKARAIVELRPQEDQYETHPDALLVLALGRVLRRAT
jgi:hypothetical protein